MNLKDLVRLVEGSKSDYLHFDLEYNQVRALRCCGPHHRCGVRRQPCASQRLLVQVLILEAKAARSANKAILGAALHPL